MKTTERVTGCCLRLWDLQLPRQLGQLLLAVPRGELLQLAEKLPAVVSGLWCALRTL